MSLAKSMASLSALLCGSLLLNGCVTQSNFPKQVAEASCDKFYECSRTLAEIRFEDPSDCVDQVERVHDKLVANCKDWHGRVASKCIDEIEDASCSEVKIGSEPCEELAKICS